MPSHWPKQHPDTSYSAAIDPKNLQAYVAAYPAPLQPLAAFFAAQIHHVSQFETERSLRRANRKLLIQIPPGKTPIVFWSRVDRSGGWVNALLYELLKDGGDAELAKLLAVRDVFFFDHDYFSELQEFLTANPQSQIVVFEDASYSVAQIKNATGSFGRLIPEEKILAGHGFATNYAVAEMHGHFPRTHFIFDQTMPTLGETLAGRPELMAMAQQVLAPGFENWVLWYFDHTCADDKSTVSLKSGARILTGAVPNEAGRTARVIPIGTAPADRPY